MRKTFAEINLSNLKYNFLNIRKKVKQTKVMAVVKADAYGHGMIECVKALSSLGEKKPDYYGVALTEEAVELRKSKLVKEPILTFSPFDPGEVKDYQKHGIRATVSSDKHIRELKKLKLTKPLRVHVKIDTGMGRLGFDHKTAIVSITKLAEIDNVEIDGIYSHFATSDELDKTYAGLQLARFQVVMLQLYEAGIDHGLAHMANSGAIIDMPEAYFDMVRPGIALYGYYPSQETTESVWLKPVMSLISHVSTVKMVGKGQSVSYGRKHYCDVDTNIATLPIGYADGINRNLTNNIEAIVKGKRYTQVGRVTMDRIMLDVCGGNVKPGDKAVLLGKVKGEEINAWHWSNKLNTIPYEITCGISKRVPRIYKD